MRDLFFRHFRPGFSAVLFAFVLVALLQNDELRVTADTSIGNVAPVAESKHAESPQSVLLSWNTFGNLGTETSESSTFNDINLSAANLTLGAGRSPSANANRFGGNQWFDPGDTNPTTLADTFTATGVTEFSNFGAGIACNYQISPTSQSFLASAGSGAFGLTTDAGCGWTAVSNAPWITITGASSGSGSGNISFSVAGNYGGPARTGTITVGEQTFTVYQAPKNLIPSQFDFDWDGRADISVTRHGTQSIWYQLTGPNYTFRQTAFGQTGDVVTPADFDGDGVTDFSIFRPSTGTTWYRSSLDGAERAVQWGASGDIPLPTDFDGNGKADFVVYRPSDHVWYRFANGGSTTPSIMAFGAAGDKPLVGDFDGDGRSDPAVFRPSTGTFWYAASFSGNEHRAIQWGLATDTPAPADYDGDGKTDVAIYRPSDGTWWIRNSHTGSYIVVTWGIAEDKPIPADYDGDLRADVAVFRPSNGTWYLLNSTAGFRGFQWGISTDVPSPGAFVP